MFFSHYTLQEGVSLVWRSGKQMRLLTLDKSMSCDNQYVLDKQRCWLKMPSEVVADQLFNFRRMNRIGRDLVLTPCFPKI